jgi:hypothetical protein
MNMEAKPQLEQIMQEEQIRTALAVSTREYQNDQPSRKLPRPRPALPPRGKKKKKKTVARS